PTLALAHALAAADDRVVDAGVRATARVAAGFSRALSWWGERGVDGVVRGAGATAVRLATASRRSDEQAVDGAVEALARGTGAAGHHSRRLQTGLAHQYYVLVGLGLVVALVVAAVGA
ncbi:MAG: NADH-quinone oxidoreductase subunit L, partial [Actinomycetota bacterium]|nr:NADH-quinone oxidoreductase subunit L [Actinomycetota bacterium]